MDKESKLLYSIYGFAIASVCFSAILTEVDIKPKEKGNEELQVPQAPPGAKNWNFTEQHWETYNPNPTPRKLNYSDEEIRSLREIHSYNSGGYYLHTPGRDVPTREKEIERYLDRHGEDLYNELRDKYED